MPVPMPGKDADRTGRMVALPYAAELT